MDQITTSKTSLAVDGNSPVTRKPRFWRDMQGTPAAPDVPGTSKVAYGAPVPAPDYAAVTSLMATLPDSDEQLDEYLHGLIRRNIRLARHLAIPRRPQHWLADQLGVDRRVVVRWENDRPPKLVTLAKIGRLLGQPLDFFFTEHPHEARE